MRGSVPPGGAPGQAAVTRARISSRGEGREEILSEGGSFTTSSPALGEGLGEHGPDTLPDRRAVPRKTRGRRRQGDGQETVPRQERSQQAVYRLAHDAASCPWHMGANP